MTITSIPPNDRRERFSASAGQTVFTFDFPIYEGESIEVRRVRAGVETVLTNGADYTVTGAGEQGGGFVTLGAGAVAGDIIVVLSAQPAARTSRYNGGGDFLAETVNRDFNRIWIELQELQLELARTLRTSITDATLGLVLPPASGRGNVVIGFDENGNPTLIPITGELLSGPAGPAGPPGPGMPVGSIAFYAGSVLPRGWIWCDGSQVSRATYAALFQAVGTTFGGGNGTTTFNVPDMRGRFPLGRDNLGAGAAANRVTLANSGVQSTTLGAGGGSELLHGHSHGVTDGLHSHGGTTDAAGVHDHAAPTGDNANFGGGANVGVNNFTSLAFRGPRTDAAGLHSHNLTIAAAASNISVNAAGGGASQNVPPCLVCNWIIFADVQLDGGGVIVTPATSFGAVPIKTFIAGKMLNAERLDAFPMPSATRFPAGGAGSFARVRIAPTANTTVLLQREVAAGGTPTTFGSVLIPAGQRRGVITISADQDVAPGDDVIFTGPATADATLEDFAMTLVGVRL